MVPFNKLTFQGRSLIISEFFKKFVFILSLFFLISSTHAQDAARTWSLEDCINFALDNNINIKKQDLGIDYQEEILTQSKLGMLPNVNAFASHGYNWGQRVDPFTNEFATDRVRSNNLYVSGDLNLFSGFQQLNRVKKNKIDLMAAQYDADSYKDDIAINVATAYIQTLFYIEFVEIANSQLEITQQQVDRTRKLVEAGTLAKGDLLVIEAQLASEEYSLIQAENDLSLSYLTLSQLMELQTPTGFVIEKPELGLIESPENVLTPDEIYNLAREIRPEIKSAQLKVESSEKDLSIAKGSLSPRISLSGSVGSGYSGANKLGTNPIYSEREFGYWYTGNPDNPTQPVYGIVQDGYESFEPKPFSEQFNDNLNETVGLNLSIPIFNGWSARSSVKQAKIGIANATYDLELQKNNLYKTIQQAYNDAKAALNRYNSAEKKVKATDESFKYAEQKFNVGLLNSVEYNDAKKEFNVALSESLQAKYDFVFRTTVIDFYLGKPLTLKR
jgi:outer membrane protein